MRIGVDARLLCGQITGLGRALIEIGKRISLINPNIIFYTPGKTDFDSGLNISSSSVYGHSFKGKISEQLWFQAFLPHYAKRDEIDVFWAPAHRLPFMMPKSIVQVLTIHDLVWISHPRTMSSFGWLLESLYMPRSITNADRVMAISDSTKSEILKKFPMVDAKLSVIKLAPAVFPLHLELCFPSDLGISKKYILFVGTLEPRKNLNRLVEAYLRLSSEIKSQYDLVLVGRDGWANYELDQLIKLNGSPQNIKLLGYVSDQELASLYRHAIFLAMPSLSEGFGLPILEAMSAGIPVLTSNCSSMPEIAGDGALLVDPLSIDSIHRGLEKMLMDIKLRRVLSSNAKKNAVKYSWDKCADDLMSLFEDAITAHKIKKI